MRLFLLALAAGGSACLTASGAPEASQVDMDAIREKVKDPANVFPVFQELIRAGEYGTAHWLLSPRTPLPYEAFAIAFTAYEATRRLIAASEVHALKQLDPGTYRVRLCSPEFGVGRDFRLVLFLNKIWTLDLTSEDIEYFKSRALGWYRHQIKRADGWHYAYPPDWTYAPLARTCICGK